MAVGDIDNDQNPEIIANGHQTRSCRTRRIIYIEWDPTNLSFPDSPLQHGAYCSQRLGSWTDTSRVDNDGNEEIIVSIMDGPWGTAGSSRLMIMSWKMVT